MRPIRLSFLPIILAMALASTLVAFDDPVAEAKVLDLAFHPAGKTLAVLRGSQTIEVRDAGTGKVLSSKTPGRRVLGGISDASLAWNADGSRILLWRDGFGVEVLDPATGTFTGPLGNKNALDFSPHPKDPRRVAVVRDGKEVEFWDILEGRKVGSKRVTAIKHRWKGRGQNIRLILEPDRRAPAYAKAVRFHPSGNGMAVWVSDRVQYVPLGRGRVEKADERRWTFGANFVVDGYGFRAGQWVKSEKIRAALPGFLKDDTNPSSALAEADPSLATAPRRGIGYAAPGGSRELQTLPSGKRLTLEGVQANVTALALDPTGTTLAVGGGDGALHLFRVLKPDAPKSLTRVGTGIHPYDAVEGDWIFSYSYDGSFEGFLLDKSRHKIGVFSGKGAPTRFGRMAKGSKNLDWLEESVGDELAIASSEEVVRVAFEGARSETLDVYKGQLKDRRPHGFGILLSPEAKSAYMGFFREGKRHGRGALLRRQSREIKRDAPSYRRITEEVWFGDWEEDNLLRGHYKVDLLAGEYLPDGALCSYDGEFRNYLAHGAGTGRAGSSRLAGRFEDGKLAKGKRTSWSGSSFRVEGGRETQESISWVGLARGDLVSIGGKVRSVYRKVGGASPYVEFADGTRAPGRGLFDPAPAGAEANAAKARLAARRSSDARAAAARPRTPSIEETLRSYTSKSQVGRTAPSYTESKMASESRARRDLASYKQYLDHAVLGKNTGVKWYR